jgi:hypothetical protein
MSLATLPDAVITRLRAQCAVFSNRVAGTAAEARASEQTEFPVPHAFFMPGGIEPSDMDTLSPLDQECTIRFRVLIAVDNKGDERGQAGATGLLTAARSVVVALIGWTPAAGFAPVMFDGLEDSFDSNRDRLWGTVSFRTLAYTSAL